MAFEPSDPPRPPRRPGTLERNPAPGRGPGGLLREDFRQQAPTVTLPKGGGAIGGIGEKFSASPVTGTASLSVPLPLSEGRQGVTPALGLSYDSGGGNGPFGLGWRLTVPSIRCKTDKGLPRYLSTDVFVLSDAEDLVPLREEVEGQWVPASRTATLDDEGYTVDRFRPRVEGGFAHIERWRRNSDRRTFWRTNSRDNGVRLYGRSDNARVVDPAEPRRVFEWLLEEERDERGNVISYQYLAEDGLGLESHPAEKRRSAVYRYLKRVSYGNTVMGQNPDAAGGEGQFRFHLVFDYGDHDEDDPTLAPQQIWPGRADPFSTFRSRFDIRCRRLCRRALMFHSFAQIRVDEEDAPLASVVRALRFRYDERPTVTTLAGVQVQGWTWTGDGYERASLPEARFSYAEPTIDPTIRPVTGLDELPLGLDMRAWQFVDLDGEGLTGLLSGQGKLWSYKRNEGQGAFALARSSAQRPNVELNAPGTRLVDLDGDGNLDVVVIRPGHAGFQSRTPEGSWGPFRSFRSLPSARLDGADIRLVDLDGDGHADLLVTEGDTLVWYPAKGREGFAAPLRIPMPKNDDLGPSFLLSRQGAHYHFADMSGDGLSDVVRILNGSISYWPNLGYGRFGPRIHMKGAPRFDSPDQFDPSRIRLADVDGSGPTDLIYIGPKGVRIWFNEAGNGWSAPAELPHIPAAARPHDVQITDLLGEGTACLIWSAPFLHGRGRALHFVKLMSEGKPWLMKQHDNGLGRSTTLLYTPSTHFYLADRRAGRPWATRLPFPVQCLSRVEHTDSVTGWQRVETYAWHHGFFDGEEREFRGFGMVEHWDTETVPGVAGPPPVRTRTWTHTGAWIPRRTLAAAFQEEFFDAPHLAEPTVPTDAGSSRREAYRALKGRVLRQEVFAEDGAGNLSHLYTITEQGYAVVALQPDAFRVDEIRTRSSAYDQPVGEATDPRVQDSLVLETDTYGTPLRTATIAYPRRGTGHEAEQLALHVVVQQVEVIHQDDRVVTDDLWRLGLPARQRSWELRDPPAWTDESPPSAATVDTAIGEGELRPLSEERTTYATDDLSGALPLGQAGLRALVYQRLALAFPEALQAELFETRVGPAELEEAGYLLLDDDAWLPSGRLVYDPLAFYQPIAHHDAWANITALTWDDDALVLTEVENPAGLTVTAETDYQRLSPFSLTDENGTQTVATFDPLGRVLTTAVRNGTDGDGEEEHSADFAYDTETLPASVHARVLRAYGGEDWEESWTYSDGGGTVVQTKVQAAPDGETARFIGTGRTVFDAKGNIVKQFEPFFSTTSAYEADSALTESGKAVHYAYDALGRNIRVTLPDGHTRTWSYTPWKVEFRDEEDNTSGGDHEDTPSTTHLDALGRAYTQVETPDGTAWHVTRVQLDVQGNVLAVIDPRGNTIQVQRFDLLGRPAFTGAADEGYDGSSGDGETRVLLDATGQPCRTWKSGGLALRTEYDALRRPVGLFVDEGSGERQVQATVFGDAVSDGPAHSLGRPVRQYDTAGEVRMSYDFRGRVVEQVRRVFEDIETEADWEGLLDEESLEDIDTWLTSNGALSAEEFTVSTEYDALDRVVEQTAPNGSVTAYSYDPGGKLVGIELDAAAVVEEILYNARGQRLSIAYGNGTETSYEYDEDRFWLTRLLTMRSTEALQDLSYTHDAVGNVLGIEDEAQEDLYFDNTQVTADQTFTYDSLYRLVQATGREKVGMAQTTFAPPAPGAIPDGGNPALRTYVQSTTYDAAGNITQVHHVPSSGSNWTRNYTIHDDNNQLLATSIPGNSSAYDDEYTYNERGAMVFLPHLRAGVSENVVRDFRDQVRKVLLLNSGDEAWYATDAAGQRVRKVVRLGQFAHERIYVGGYEVYRKLNTVNETLDKEIETLHVHDGQRRVAMIETKTVGTGSPVTVVRYQYDNHLGSAVLECDESGEIISYEEFHPYGTTAWWAQDSSIQVSLKRYRYTGMERDEETGMQMHGVRGYLPWLGRWERVDPAGLVDGGNRWAYVRGNPVGGRDPTGLSWLDSMAGSLNSVKQQVKAVAAETMAEAGRRFEVAQRALNEVSSEAFETWRSGVDIILRDPVGVATDVYMENTPVGLAFQGDLEGAQGVYLEALIAPAKTVVTAMDSTQILPNTAKNTAEVLSGELDRAKQGVRSQASDTMAVVETGLLVLPAMGGAPRGGLGLVHLTTPEAAASIRSTSTLGRGGGIYAGPSSNASATGFGITWRTGLPPSKAGVAIEIPDGALSAFSKPVPIGPISAWQRLTGQQFTQAGKIDLATGTFTATGANWNQRLIYGLDLTLDTTAVVGGALLYESAQ